MLNNKPNIHVGLRKNEILDSFNSPADAGFLTAVTGAKEAVVFAPWQMTMPIFGKVSILMNFVTSANGK